MIVTIGIPMYIARGKFLEKKKLIDVWLTNAWNYFPIENLIQYNWLTKLIYSLVRILKLAGHKV